MPTLTTLGQSARRRYWQLCIGVARTPFSFFSIRARRERLQIRKLRLHAGDGCGLEQQPVRTNGSRCQARRQCCGRTLWYCAEGGCTPRPRGGARLLLGHGANIHASWGKSGIPLQVARPFQRHSIVQLLLDHRAGDGEEKYNEEKEGKYII
jgi:hypothetical protein